NGKGGRGEASSTRSVKAQSLDKRYVKHGNRRARGQRLQIGLAIEFRNHDAALMPPDATAIHSRRDRMKRRSASKVGAAHERASVLASASARAAAARPAVPDTTSTGSPALPQR